LLPTGADLVAPTPTATSSASLAVQSRTTSTSSTAEATAIYYNISSRHLTILLCPALSFLSSPSPLLSTLTMSIQLNDENANPNPHTTTDAIQTSRVKNQSVLQAIAELKQDLKNEMKAEFADLKNEFRKELKDLHDK